MWTGAGRSKTTERALHKAREEHPSQLAPAAHGEDTLLQAVCVVSFTWRRLGIGNIANNERFCQDNPGQEAYLCDISGRKAAWDKKTTGLGRLAPSPEFPGSIAPSARQNELHRYATAARAFQQNVSDTSR